MNLYLARIRVELKQFFRNRQAMIFTFSLPILMLVIFASIFHGRISEKSNVDFRQYFISGIIAVGIFGTGFSSLAIRIAIEQDDGTLKRLAGTPMPKSAYLVGKLGMVVVAAVCQTAIMLALGVAFYGLKLPSTPGRWLTFVWVFILGAIGAALVGISYSRLIKNSRAAAAVTQPPYLVLQFISGVFFVYSNLPRGLQLVASLFPLKWMAQGLRSVFLPDGFAAQEPAGSWQHPLTALVLVAWVVGGFLATSAFFRWRTREV